MKDLVREVLISISLCLSIGNYYVMGLCQEDNKLNTVAYRNLEMLQEECVFLPKIFSLDEREKCPSDYYYCKMNIKLYPMNQENSSTTWKTIQKINTRDGISYRRDLIYRATCVGINDTELEYGEYSNLGLRGRIDELYCEDDRKLPELVDKIDLFFLNALFCYLCLIIYCTLKTYFKKEDHRRNRYIEIFSAINTWKDLTVPKRNEDFNNLLFFQGTRTILTSLVILIHNFMFLMVLFNHSPEYLEGFHFHPIHRVLTGSFGLTVQIFFVLSSWLHAVHLFNLEKNNGTITVKDIFIITLNRYFRLIPAMIIVIFMHRSAIPSSFLNPLYHSYHLAERSRCQSGWWRNILLIQNLPIFEGQACLPSSWFIAADTHLFLFFTVCFYLSRKFKIPLKNLLAVSIGISVGIQTYTVMTYNFGGLFRINPRLLPLEQISTSPQLLLSHFATRNHLTTYAVGFGFGTLYAQYKNENIFDTRMKKLLWISAFCGLPIIASVLHSYNYPLHLEILMTISLRPLFSLGIAVGFLGMASRTGGLIRRFLEWEPLVFLGNLNYSVYMSHFSILYIHLASFSKMVDLNSAFYLRNLATDLIVSYAVGLLTFFILEHPCSQLQKKFLPQVKMKKRTNIKSN